LGLLDSMGTIEQGKTADLVLLDANPLRNIMNTQKIAAVVVGGKFFDKTKLQNMLAQVEAQAAICQAVVDGDIERVKLLISKGPDLNEENEKGQIPLNLAAREGHKEIVELLLEHGADVNVGSVFGKEYNNWIAAEFAMHNNHTEIAQLLISKGADISPLFFAIYMEDEIKARSLIEGGADVNSRTPGGITPLHQAVNKGLKDIVELLIAYDADVNAGHYWGWTPLHSAAIYGYEDIAELLINAGANVIAKDEGGLTPLWYAKDEGHTEIAELLRRHGAKE
jgi:ankyrin repeat protein